MCGITGFVSKKFSEANLSQMTACLQHRGPDADGKYYNAQTGVGLGHLRLSIIDLSAAANQPMWSHNKRYVIIFNGEIYNYKEVAAKYKLQMNTTSDTEVILEAFDKAGIECVNDLNGMFAFALWDTQDEKLYLVRDRMGVKPLYYYYDNGELAFGSELKSIFTLPLPKKISKDSVTDFLYLGYIPGENTIYTGFKKIKPGHYAVWHKGNLDIKPYWQVEKKIHRQVLSDEKEAKQVLKGLVESSVDYCMVSDVPVGIFLSGGIDSSIVAAAAQSVSDQPVKTFSIGFREKKYNEAHFADEVARYIGSDHYEFIVSEQDGLHWADKLTGIYDEPYADSSAIPMLMVSELARKHVKVALSGDGGDELFMGYSFYYWARRLNNPLIKMFRKPLAEVLHTFGSNRIKRGSYVFRYRPEKIHSHIFSQEQYYFTESEIKKLLKCPGEITIEEGVHQDQRKLTATEAQSFFDMINYLPEELLVKADRASMHHSLEVRVPLLDHRLVEFALNLSPELKLRGQTGKYLLKQVLYDYVPSSLFDRPKWGFAFPLRIWLRNELSYLPEKYLSPSVIEECGLVDAGIVRQLLQEFKNGKDYLYNRIWALIVLHKWYKEKHVSQ